MKTGKRFNLKDFLKENWIALIPYVMFVIMFAVMGVLNSSTLTLRYIANKMDAAFSLILCAAGQTLVLLTGGFDLSVGGVICMTNSLSASRMQDNLGSMLLWALICLMIGLGIGIFNGYVIEKTKLQPFIVTLAVQYICYGAALLILKVDGGLVPASYISGLLHRFGPIPLSMILTVVLILAWLFFKNTKPGFSIYAVGSNENAARLNGISILRTKMLAYGLSGAFAALAGLFRTAQVASGSPTAGADFVMISISSAVIGGTALTGGSGGMIGTVVGALVLRTISDLLVFMKVSSYWSSLVQGVLLILAVAASAYGSMLKRRGGAAS
ncbi:MAG: ABC transporter permease [Lachnospiraceae bacterium]|jgi:ribose transport system permease protein|nr:ABC transporter permease [Lachnospiraceae bacterium]